MLYCSWSWTLSHISIEHIDRVRSRIALLDDVVNMSSGECFKRITAAEG
jgi:hypothetical protein